MSDPDPGPAKAVPSITTTTRGFGVKDQVELWHEQLAGFSDFTPATRDHTDFVVESTTWHFGPLVVIDCRIPPRRQVRSAQKIRAHQIDPYRLILQNAGSLRLDADGRRVVVQPGQMVLADMTRPESYDADASDSVILHIERDALDRLLPRPLDLNGLVPQGAMADMLASTLRATVQHAAQLEADTAPAVATAILELIAAAAASSAGEDRLATPRPADSLLQRARAAVDERLTDSSLDVATLCAALNVSRATLYRVFEPLGGVAGHVREQRLLRIHELLSAPSGKLHLGRLASDFGFRSQAHFSQLFRERFGYSPSHVPALAAPQAASALPAGSDAASLAQWVLGLRR